MFVSKLPFSSKIFSTTPFTWSYSNRKQDRPWISNENTVEQFTALFKTSQKPNIKFNIEKITMKIFSENRRNIFRSRKFILVIINH